MVGSVCGQNFVESFCGSHGHRFGGFRGGVCLEHVGAYVEICFDRVGIPDFYGRSFGSDSTTIYVEFQSSGECHSAFALFGKVYFARKLQSPLGSGFYFGVAQKREKEVGGNLAGFRGRKPECEHVVGIVANHFAREAHAPFFECGGGNGALHVEFAVEPAHLAGRVYRVDEEIAQRKVSSKVSAGARQMLYGFFVCFCEVAGEEERANFGELFRAADCVLDCVGLTGPQGDFVECYSLAVDSPVDNGAQSAITQGYAFHPFSCGRLIPQFVGVGGRGAPCCCKYSGSCDD